MQHMTPQGILQNKEAEGYHKALPDGRCKSYQCQAGRWTIGWGCTEGVTPGMIWTVEQAEEALAAEIAKFEEVVNRLVKVPLDAGQFDCLTMFAFNVGAAGFERSTLLKLLNRKQYSAVPGQLMRWCKYHNPKTGRIEVSKGLRNRRMREIRVWNGEHLEHTQVADEGLPQAVVPTTGDKAQALKSSTTVGGAAVGLFSVVAGYFNQTVSMITDAGMRMAELGSMKTFCSDIGLSVKSITFAMAVASIIYVVQRRLEAASEQKEG